VRPRIPAKREEMTAPPATATGVPRQSATISAEKSKGRVIQRVRDSATPTIGRP
jgi:hypothetical protein